MENLHKGHRERLRQSYIENGPDGMHEHQLLELLLTYAIPRRDTNPIAHGLLDKSAFGSLWEVLNAGPKELMAVEGIGESAAVLLSLVGAMGRRAKAKGVAAQKKRLNTPDAAMRYCKSLPFNDTNVRLCYSNNSSVADIVQYGRKKGESSRHSPFESADFQPNAD